MKQEEYEIFSRPTDILSQWYLCSFKDKKSVQYNSAEQYMMAHKALLFETDNSLYNKIMQTKDMRTIKQLGKKVIHFKQEIWDEKKESIVYEGNYLKFSQNKKLKDFLLSTEKKVIVEANPNDFIWAVGLHPDDKNIQDKNRWKGKNLLGNILMRIREKLINKD
jgi:hypothetical protein